MYSDVEEFEGWKYRYNYNKKCIERVTKITDDWYNDDVRWCWSEDEEKKQKCLKAFSILFSESVDTIREGVAVC